MRSSSFSPLSSSSSSSSSLSTSSASSRTLLDAFDQRCFVHGDSDAIVFHCPSSFEEEAVCFTEIRECSLQLAYQVFWRFGGSEVDFVLLYLRNETVAEAVAMISSLRLGVPFVPLPTVDDDHKVDDTSTLLNTNHLGIQRLVAMIQHLRGSGANVEGRSTKNHIDGTRLVAIVQCDSEEQVDNDPIVKALEKYANVHNYLYVNKRGDLWNSMDVSQSLPSVDQCRHASKRNHLYVLFTSGTSGGTPKAVVGSHQSTWNRVEWFGKNYCSSSPSSLGSVVVARRTKFTFVDSITELWTGLLYGQLYSFSNGQLDKEGIKVILETPCTHVTMLPSQLAQLLRYLEKEKPQQAQEQKQQQNRKTNDADPKSITTTTSNNHDRSRFKTRSSLQVVVISGEAAPPQVVENFHRFFSTQGTTLLNLYGQTESTGDVLCANLTTMNRPIVKGVVSVGQPILPHLIHVRCNAKNTSEEEGEIVVRGNLSHGYLHALFPSEEVEFFTGDVGFRHNGSWYIRGRKNDAVKIHGVWTQPTEVEAVFQKVWGNVDCVATILNEGAEQNDPSAFVLIEDLSIVQSFTREEMRRAGVPWHLIPRRVLYGTIPQGQGGAGKVNRWQVKTWIQEQLLSTDTKTTGKSSLTLSPRGEEILSVIQRVLGRDRFVVDESKSFVECGGDSALAITLMYELKSFTEKSQPTTRTIVTAPSLRHLAQQLADAKSAPHASNKSGEEIHVTVKAGRPLDEKDDGHDDNCHDDGTNTMPLKKKKVCAHASGMTPRGTVAWEGVDKDHAFVQFKACVDASPIYANQSLYGACQGGLVQRISNISGAATSSLKVTASFQFPEGFRIQADPIAVSSSEDDGMQRDNLLNQRSSLVGVCGYHPTQNSSIVVALNPDLTQQWATVLNHGLVKASPVIVSDLVGNVSESNKSVFLAVLAGPNLVLLSVSDGTIQHTVPLPSSAESRPVVVQQQPHATSDSQKNGDVCWIVIAFADWDVGIAIVTLNHAGAKVHMIADSVVVAPVYANLVRVGSDNSQNEIIICDVLGQVHVLPLCNVMTMTLAEEATEVITSDSKIRKAKLSSKPIFSTPQVLWEGEKGSTKLLLGCHDGWLRCINLDNLTVAWDSNAHGVICAAPIVCYGTTDASTDSTWSRGADRDALLDCYVLTTAGDILTHACNTASNSTNTLTKRWHVQGEIWSDPTLVENNLLCFGARDSRLHLFRIR